MWVVFFFQAEDGIRDKLVTGVQTCALPIFVQAARHSIASGLDDGLRRASRVMSSNTPKGPVTLARWIPAIGWLRGYKPGWLRGDLVAAITLAAYLLPAALG